MIPRECRAFMQKAGGSRRTATGARHMYLVKTAVLERLVGSPGLSASPYGNARAYIRVTCVMCTRASCTHIYVVSGVYRARHTTRTSPTGFLIRLNDGSSAAAAQSFLLRGVTRAFNRARWRKRSRSSIALTREIRVWSRLGPRGCLIQEYREYGMYVQYI